MISLCEQEAGFDKVVGPNSEPIILNSEAAASSGPRSSVVELLICNQRVGGSNPSVGSRFSSVLRARGCK